MEEKDQISSSHCPIALRPCRPIVLLSNCALPPRGRYRDMSTLLTTQERHISQAPPPPLSVERSVPLREVDYVQIRQAAITRKPIDRATRVARSSAISILVVGFIALPFATLALNLSSYAVAGAICLVGWLELRGSQQMSQAIPQSAKRLGFNQLAFMALILLYAIWQMLRFSLEGAKDVLISPDVQSQLSQLGAMQDAVNEQLEVWAPLVVYGLYGSLIVLSVLFQGGLALYYFTRSNYLVHFNQTTPKWIKRLWREMGV